MPEADARQRTADGRDRVATWWVQAQPESAAVVRHEIARELRDAGVPTQLVDDAVLVASELVGNAIRHARALPAGHLAVTSERRAEGITIRVTDGGGGQHPSVRAAEPHDTTGRGLSIVAALTDSWGVMSGPDTVTVWARIPDRTPVPV
jgi:anti-sigma regulatory factor (Ser/Thr protein kinase)